MKVVIGLVVLLLLCGNVLGQNQTEESGATEGVASGRVVNGTEVSIRNHPFVVLLRVDDFGICGASIITNNHALTAAHCLDWMPDPTTVTLYGGSSSQHSGGVIFYATSYVLHPNYDQTSLDNDAAIVTVRNSFAGFKNVAPIRVRNQPIKVSSTSPTWCYVVGWGYTNGQTQADPEYLQYASLQLLSYNSCVKKWRPIEVTQQMVCAQYKNVDICSGDSGGPLVCNAMLTGIVSWGTEGCTGRWPAVFTNVASGSIRKFIKTNTRI